MATFALAQCPSPTNVSVSATGPYTASFTFNLNGGQSLEIAAGNTGFTPTQPTHGMSNITTSPYNRGSMHASRTYEFYVRNNCGNGNFSPWVGPFSLTMPPAPTACAKPTNIQVSDIQPYSVVFNMNLNGATHFDMTAGNPGFTPTQPTHGMNDLSTLPYRRASLHQGRTYEFYVRADCGRDNTNVSEWVGPITVTTATVSE